VNFAIIIDLLAQMFMIETTIKNLEKNNMNAFFVETRKDAVAKALELIPEGASVGFGGSETLEQIGIFQEIEKRNFKFIDRRNAKTREENIQMRKQTLLADVFLTSSNAVTRDGKLVNVDGTGNRVAAMIFGPEKVIVIVGKNKIVENEDDAIKRIKTIAAPTNAKRLGRKTPCVATGRCMDCNSPERICCTTVVQGWQTKPRINVIIVNEELGY